MEKNEHFIVMRRGDRAKLKAQMHTTDATVSDALNYRRHSELARRIRVASINFHNGIFF